jgi:GxxExxY protein
MEYFELTQTVIGCAFRVHGTLGFGFLESVYEKALLVELRRAGLEAGSQVPLTVYYEGVVVGEFFADILVDDAVILELKSVRAIAPAHEVQLVNYLSATRKPIGLIINFGERSVEVKRRLRELPRTKEADNEPTAPAMSPPLTPNVVSAPGAGASLNPVNPVNPVQTAPSHPVEA